MDRKIPIGEKYLLSIPEAVEYFGIGEKKLRVLIDRYRQDERPFVVMNGTKHLIARKRFEQFLDETSTI